MIYWKNISDVGEIYRQRFTVCQASGGVRLPNLTFFGPSFVYISVSERIYTVDNYKFKVKKNKFIFFFFVDRKSYLMGPSQAHNDN